MYNSYSCVPVSNYKTKSDMIDISDIIEAYFLARKNKRKSIDQVEFELHWEMNCLRLYNDIINHEVRPTAYTFITEYPRPREVFASEFCIRILHHFIDKRMRPLLEARLSKHTFNNRIGMGQNACQNAVVEDIYNVSDGFTKDAYIVKLDLSGCFPNIVQDIAYRQLEEVVLNDYYGNDKDELIYILNLCIFSYPTQHCYRKSRLSKWKLVKPEKSLFNKPLGIGAAIGHLIWQNAVNYYFHEIDEWILSLGVCYERYVDDMYFIVDSKTFLLMIPNLRDKLASIGAKLNDNKFYCQHYTKGCECLGVHIKMDRIYLNRRIVKRGILRARSLSRRVYANKVQTLLSSINSYLGMCKNVNGYNSAMKILKSLSPKWGEYVKFDRRRVCVVAKTDYTLRNTIISKFKLNNDKRRKRRKAPRAKRAYACPTRRNAKDGRQGFEMCKMRIGVCRRISRRVRPIHISK